MRRDYSLQSSFELRGEFWLPANVEQQIAGIVRVEAGRIELELLGSFGDEMLPLDAQPLEADLILGSTNEGPCTLWKAGRSRASTTFGGVSEVAQSAWSALYLFAGAHFDRTDSIAFSSVDFGFEGLESWLAQPPFEVGSEPGSPGAAATVARHEFPQPAVVALSEQDAKLKLARTFSRTGELFRTLSWTSDAYFELEPDEPRHFDWYMEQLGHVRAFLGLLMGEPVAPTRIGGRLPNDAITHVVAIFQPTGAPAKRTLHPAEMVLSYDKLGDRFENVVQRWFERRETLSTTVSLLFGTLYTTGLPWEFQFLALTQALETFHRTTCVGMFVSSDEYQAVEEALIRAIPDSIPADLRQALKSRIGYGNEVSQRRRFKELLASLASETRGLITSDPAFVDRIVEQRNYLTHYPTGVSSPMDPAELFYATFRLRALLMLLLLAEIGITGTEAAEGVRRLRWYRGYVGA